eukprot:5491798-Heterocapsa_arctica.AAC.1
MVELFGPDGGRGEVLVELRADLGVPDLALQSRVLEQPILQVVENTVRALVCGVEVRFHHISHLPASLVVMPTSELGIVADDHQYLVAPQLGEAKSPFCVVPGPVTWPPSCLVVDVQMVLQEV